MSFWGVVVEPFPSLVMLRPGTFSWSKVLLEPRCFSSKCCSLIFKKIEIWNGVAILMNDVPKMYSSCYWCEQIQNQMHNESSASNHNFSQLSSNIIQAKVPNKAKTALPVQKINHHCRPEIALCSLMTQRSSSGAMCLDLFLQLKALVCYLTLIDTKISSNSSDQNFPPTTSRWMESRVLYRKNKYTKKKEREKGPVQQMIHVPPNEFIQKHCYQ